MIKSVRLLVAAIAALMLGTGEAGAWIVKPTKLTPTITWEITSDSILKITGTGAMPDFDYKKLKHWREKKYFPNSIKRIEIGEGITRLGESSFHYLSWKHPRKEQEIVMAKLPSTLKEIPFWGCTDVVMESSELPEHLDKVLWLAFEGSKFPDGRIILPENVNEVRGDGSRYFGAKGLKEVVMGSCKNLQNLGFITEFTRVVITDPQFNFAKLKNLEGKLDMKNKVIVLPEGTGYDSATLYGMKVESPELKAKTEADKTVSGYIANRLGTWDEYVKRQNLPAVPTVQTAQDAIEKEIAEWQKKGEFESTSEWQARVNETTRAARVKTLTRKWNDKAVAAQREYNTAVEGLKGKYRNEHERLQKEFYTNLAKTQTESYKGDSYRIDTPYDADNQTFLITSDNHGDILLRVPKTEAPAFKSNWGKVEKEFAFKPVSESEVGLSRIIFKLNGKQYVYDGKDTATYSVADIDYNFAPLEVSGLQFDGIALPDLAEAPTTSKTVTSKAIQTKKVEVNKTKLTAGNGGGGTPVADVDRTIPQGTTTRNNTFALIIANENYRRAKQVDFATNDGAIFAQYCQKTLGIPNKNVTVVNDASLNDMKYQLKHLEDICKAYGGDASLIVYYAGHGVPEESSGDAYLLPTDGYAEDVTTGMSMQELITTLSSLPAKQTTMFVDACFSGTDRGGETLTAARAVALKAKPTQAKGKMVVFSAAQGVETAHPYTDNQHGMFTYFLLKKLNETKGGVTLGELADYIIENVQRTSVVEGKMQTPTVSASSTLDEWRSIKL